MARSTTITLTAQEAAVLFAYVNWSLDQLRPTMTRGEKRIANSVQAKCTAALIATQKDGGS